MKALQWAALAAIVLAVFVAPVLAQTPTEKAAGEAKAEVQGVRLQSAWGAGLGAGIGAAFILVGAGYGFGRIGSAALESMARQPEIAGSIQTAMIVIAALLEGATFFALLICILINNKATF